jgi:opacity protein-like surface antigen
LFFVETQVPSSQREKKKKEIWKFLISRACLMKMSYFRSLSPLLVVFSTQSLADNWEQARNEGRASVALQSVDNLFNSEQEISATKGSLGASYDWLGLYEGFGVHTPIAFSQHRYMGQGDLDYQQWQIEPAARLFLSSFADFTLYSHWSADSFLAGEEQAEFIEDGQQVQWRERRVGGTLQFGHAPDTQNLSLDFSASKDNQYLNEQRINEHSSDKVSLEYSVRFSENARALLSAELRHEEIRTIASKLVEVGAGVLYRWTSNQQLKLVAGAFRRDTPAAEDQTGQFWQFNNDWQLTQQWMLSIGTSRHSVLAQQSQAISQLQTQHQLVLNYQPWQQHHLQFGISQKTLELDQLQRRRQSLQWQAGWRWDLTDDWSLATQYRYRSLELDSVADSVVQSVAGFTLEWQW